MAVKGIKRRLQCNLDISSLRALVALRELASFTRVSERVHLSSSAVFCQIRQLEDQTGQKLYERQGKVLQLTGNGNSLADYAHMIIHMHDSTLETFKPQAAKRRETIRLGCGPHGSVEIVPYLVQAFVKQHPDTEVRLTSADDNTLLNALRSNQLDAVFMSLHAEMAGLQQRHLWTQELVLVFPPVKSNLFPNPQIDDLRAAPFILFRRPVLMEAAFQQLCKELGFEPNVVMENDETDSIKELVKLGLGVSFLPFWSVAEEVRTGKLRIVRMPRSQLYKYGLLYRAAGYDANMLAKLVALAEQWKQWWPLAKYVSSVAPATTNSGESIPKKRR